jgi:chromosome segregation ATPase
MTDILERLRQTEGSVTRYYRNPDGPEAADEIERLRDRVKDYEDSARITLDDCGAPDEKHCSCVPTLRAEIERLRAEVEQQRLELGITEDAAGMLESEVMQLRAEVETIKASCASAAKDAVRFQDERDALRALLNRARHDWPILECQDFHHRKADKHKDWPCPVQQRWDALLNDINAALAAREGK